MTPPIDLSQRERDVPADLEAMLHSTLGSIPGVALDFVMLKNVVELTSSPG